MIIRINMVGLLKDQILDFIRHFDIENINVSCIEKHYETYVDIDAIDGQNVDDLIREIFTKFKSHIYGTNEENIYKAVFELLDFKNKKLAIVEDISGGRLCSELINANNNTSSIFVEGLICTSIDSKIKRLGISREFFNSHSIMDAECCYEMASGLVMSSLADIVIATCGQMIDDNKSDCFIAVGDKDFIHVFKHSFEGTKNHIIQQISKFAFLHLIKKIRHNDFDFVENII